MVRNPYNFTDPVRRPELFFGRRTLLDEIVGNFCSPNPASYSLVGGRRYGKTSLLRAVERTLTARLKSATPSGAEVCTIPIYIDLNFETINSRGAFFALVIRYLRAMLQEHLRQIPLEQNLLEQMQREMAAENDLLFQFERAFELIRQAAFPYVGVLQVVLLIDESEHILRQSWAPELHSNLRALLSNRPKVQDHLGIKMAGSSNFYAKITEVGSPLRNILVKRFLPPLTNEEALALINEPTDCVLSPRVIEELVRQSGGHPFLLQYLMSHLWEEGLATVDVDVVQVIIEQFHEERDDFCDWSVHIGAAGLAAYQLLCERDSWVKRTTLFEQLQFDGDSLRKGLEALVYHGVVAQDRRLGYRVRGVLFRDWFVETQMRKLLPATPAPDQKQGDSRNQQEQLLGYLDFELLVTPDNRARVHSLQGNLTGTVHLDRNEIGLALTLLKQGATNADLLKRIGSKLYQALFPPALHAHLRASIAAAAGARQSVRLCLTIEPPELAALPWELLYDGEANLFLANDVRTVVARYIPVREAYRELKAAHLPLKILVVIASAQDLPALDAATEEQLIRNALANHVQAGRVTVDVLTMATLRNINQQLSKKEYDVFHFIGHGVFADNQGKIGLVDADNKARWVDDETFGNLFLNNRSLGLAVLNACQGATTSSTQPLVGVASHLVQRGLPAVIAMQFPILDSTAKLFADEFYRMLALGWPVGAAIQSTRNTIAMEVGLAHLDFAAPVLFMRMANGELFQFIG